MKLISFMVRRGEYPWQDWEAGVRAAGLDLAYSWSSDFRYGDPNLILSTWHPYGGPGEIATRHRLAGGLHIVLENGYIRRDAAGAEYFLLEIGGFNGRGQHPGGGPQRWVDFKINIAPWRRGGEKIVVCGQRGGGYSPYAMPNSWPDDVCRRLQHLTKRPIAFRTHPGARRAFPLPAGIERLDSAQPIADALRDAHAAVVWASNAATDALLLGIPVFYEGPSLKLADLARRGLEGIETPLYGARELACHFLAYSQWNRSELRSGEPLKRLLAYAREAAHA